MKPATLVTGGTGFIGSAVLRKLHSASHRVRALVRPGSDRRNLAGIEGLEVVTGDLRDRASLRAALEGCDSLFHVAADYRLWAPDPQDIFKTNVDGTRDLMLQALESRVKRVVYTSSVATLGLNADASPADETTPVGIEQMIGAYKRSKFVAEEEVKRLVREEGLPAVIVNPSAPVGPRDIKPTPTGRMILDAAAGQMPAYVDTGLNIVHVDDVAHGHLLAYEKGVAGERYILGESNLTLQQIFQQIADITGARAPRLRLPHNLILPIAYVAEGMASITKKEPRLTVDGIRLAKKYMFFSIDKAVRELGFRPRPAKDALTDAVQWFRDNDYL